MIFNTNTVYDTDSKKEVPMITLTSFPYCRRMSRYHTDFSKDYHRLYDFMDHDDMSNYFFNRLVIRYNP